MVSEEHWELGEAAKVFAASAGMGGYDASRSGARGWVCDCDVACASHIARVLGSTGHALADSVEGEEAGSGLEVGGAIEGADGGEGAGAGSAFHQPILPCC